MFDINKTVFRSKFFDMPFSGARSAQIALSVMVIFCTILASILTTLTPLDALIAGLIATFIFFASDVVHHYGHFLAAKQVGKRAIGVRFWWLFGTTRYPPNEGELTPTIHIRRAIGGPIISMVVLIGFLFLGSFLWRFSDMARFIIGWGIAVNAVWYVLGALIPIGFANFATDGMTILRAWQTQQKQS